MHPISAPWRFGRRLGILCLALFAACSLLTGNAKPAYAETTQRWTVMDFNMSNYLRYQTPGQVTPETSANARRYRYMVDQLRELASHPLTYADAGMAQSPRELNSNIIEMRIWDNFRSDIALYFSASNLYLLGFAVDGVHWRFSDTPSSLARELQAHYGGPLPLFNNLGYTGRYRDLDPGEDRGNFRYTSERFANAMQSLRHVRDGDTRRYRGDIAAVIGATSEAARFGWIQRRIDTVILNGRDPQSDGTVQNLGNFGVGLENAWSSLSRAVHESLRGETTRPVTVDHRTYRNWTDVSRGVGDNQSIAPRIAPFISLYASGN
ncbi:ribosome-inactivating family protein [Streptomyces sp. NPDC045470]|uniref:ribosome-inactivating family protein n=1 Tax=unclassified Streptomyces TaxID=2593676 RepID=UPI00340D3784